MTPRSITSTALAASALAALALPVAPALAGGGYAPPAEWTITVTATGPGTVSGAGVVSLRDATVSATTLLSSDTLTPTQDGNNAEFRGWLGACASAGTGPCTVQLARAGSGECLWTAALFAYPGELTPTPRDPCAPAGGGSGGAPSGGGGGSGSAGSGSSTGGTGAALPGGATVVSGARRLTGTTVRLTGRAVTARGTAPAGTTRMVQSLLRVGRQGVTVAGRCRITNGSRAFSCSARPPAGRWRVITQARRGSTVLGQSTVTVTVR